MTMIYQSPELIEQSRELAVIRYGNLAYHNWSHVESMLEYAETRLPVLTELNVEIDQDELVDAIMWHDAAYILDANTYGHTSKEEHSAWLAAENLKTLGRDESYIARVMTDIRSTELGLPRPTNVATLTVEADMHNVAGNKNTFFLNGLRLAIEQIQTGQVLPTDAHTFLQDSAKFLQQYFTQPFIYTAKDGTLIEMGNFSSRAISNITKMGSATVEQLVRTPGCSTLIPKQWRD